MASELVNPDPHDCRRKEDADGRQKDDRACIHQVILLCLRHGAPLVLNTYLAPASPKRTRVNRIEGGDLRDASETRGVGAVAILSHFSFGDLTLPMPRHA